MYCYSGFSIVHVCNIWNTTVLFIYYELLLIISVRDISLVSINLHIYFKITYWFQRILDFITSEMGYLLKARVMVRK